MAASNDAFASRLLRALPAHLRGSPTRTPRTRLEDLDESAFLLALARVLAGGAPLPEPPHPNSAPLEAVLCRLGDWARQGFPKAAPSYAVLLDLQSVAYWWLFPRAPRRRAGTQLWLVVCFTATLLGMYDLAHQVHLPASRVRLRALGPALQEIFLRRDWRHRGWALYVSASLEALRGAMACGNAVVPLQGRAAVYTLWSHRSGHWYIGKANCRRVGHGPRSVHGGVVSRFREHLAATYLAPGTRPRYRLWRDTPPKHLRFLVCAVRSEREAFKHEAACIQMLRPSTQAPERDTPSTRAKRDRPWPRFRARPSIEREKALNVQTRLRTDWRTRVRYELADHSLDSLLAHARRQHGLSRAGFERRAYHWGFEAWLALLLATPRSHFDWGRLWARPTPLLSLARVWVAAGRLDPARCTTARRRVDRFLASSRLALPRHTWVGVPAHSPSTLAAARGYAANLLHQTFGQPALCRLVASRLHFHRAAGPNVSTRAGHRQAAASADAGAWREEDKRSAHYTAALQRLDSQWLPHHWDARVPEDPASTADAVARQLEKVWPGHLPWLRGLARSAAELADRLRPHLLDPAHDPSDLFPAVPPGSVLVPLDRDRHRRVLTSVWGYQQRLLQNYCADPAHYEPRWDASLDDLLREHEALRARFVPARWAPPGSVQLSQLPHPYTTAKGKCLAKLEPGLSCGRDHAHDREICAAPCHPSRSFMRATARATRLVQRLSGRAHWTLWKQADLASVARQRFGRLVALPEYSLPSPCGAFRWPAGHAHPVCCGALLQGRRS